MRKSAPRKQTVATSPINFRMPAALRTRLRRFAKERSLGEAEALRLVVSEHLNQIDDERERADAERWQLEQAMATFERYRRGEEKTVSADEIEELFREALPRSRGTAAR